MEHRIELQSVRGIAAVIVVLSHCTFYYTYDPLLKLWAEAAFNAHAAVICFFVLSGFVLAHSLQRGGLNAGSLINFAVRRGFRIYPTLWVACAFSLTYPVLLSSQTLPPIVDPWWGIHSRQAPSIFTLAGAFAGVTTSLKVPVWTLYVELIGSAFMPLIVWSMAKGKRVFSAMIATFLVLSQVEGWPLLLSPLRYLIFFALGAAMSQTLPLVLYALRTPATVLAAALGCFLVMWFARWGFDARFLVNYTAPVPALIEGVAAAALIGIVYAAPAPFAVLRHRWATFLGDISYSVYLLHLPILGWTAYLLGELFAPAAFNDPSLGTIILMVITLGLSVVASALAFRYVELPGINLGKAVAKSLAIRRSLV